MNQALKTGIGVVLFAVAAHARIINVPKITWNQPDGTVITFQERVSLSVDVRRHDRYQVRFLHGTKEQLKRGWIHARANETCVAIPSVVFIPEGIDNGIVDLGFPRIAGWVEADHSETYVLVLEQIDTPDERHFVRLKPEFASTYIDRGLEVVLQAPPKPSESAPSRIAQVIASIFSAFFPSANASPTLKPAPPPPPPPRTEGNMECMQFP